MVDKYVFDKCIDTLNISMHYFLIDIRGTFEIISFKKIELKVFRLYGLNFKPELASFGFQVNFDDGSLSGY